MEDLTTLPDELLLQIAEHLFVDAENGGPSDHHDFPLRDVAAWAATSRRFHKVLNDKLYKLDAEHNESGAMIWGAIKNMVPSMEHSLRNGGDINVFRIAPSSDVVQLNWDNLDLSPRNARASGTPLHFASGRGSTDAVTWLLGKGATVRNLRADMVCPCHEQCLTPAHLAICANPYVEEIALQLIRHDPCSRQYRCDFEDDRLDQCASLDEPIQITYPPDEDEDGITSLDTLLHFAVKYNRLSLVDELLSDGQLPCGTWITCDRNARDHLSPHASSWSETALSMAVESYCDKSWKLFFNNLHGIHDKMTESACADAEEIVYMLDSTNDIDLSTGVKKVLEGLPDAVKATDWRLATSLLHFGSKWADGNPGYHRSHVHSNTLRDPRLLPEDTIGSMHRDGMSCQCSVWRHLQPCSQVQILLTIKKSIAKQRGTPVERGYNKYEDTMGLKDFLQELVRHERRHDAFMIKMLKVNIAPTAADVGAIELLIEAGANVHDHQFEKRMNVLQKGVRCFVHCAKDARRNGKQMEKATIDMFCRLFTLLDKYGASPYATPDGRGGVVVDPAVKSLMSLPRNTLGLKRVVRILFQKRVPSLGRRHELIARTLQAEVLAWIAA